jgi:vitamin B12 transporter
MKGNIDRISTGYILRALCFFIVLCIGGQLAAQNATILSDENKAAPLEDTIIGLKAVSVYAAKPSLNYQLDSIAISAFKGQQLDELLFVHAGIFIKRYGDGQLSTPSFRGTASRHTGLYWNGLPLNSPLNGTWDLSLFPVLGLSELQILPGTSSAGLGSGTPGGALQIDSRVKPVAELASNQATRIQLGGGFGSYGHWNGFGLLSHQTRIKKTNIASKIWAQLNGAENDFIVNHPALEIHNRTEASFNRASYGLDASLLSSKGALFDLSIQSGKSTREIPPVLQAVSQGEAQDDTNLLSNFTYRQGVGAWSWAFRTGYVSEENIYKNDTLSIYADNKSNSFLGAVKLAFDANKANFVTELIGQKIQGSTDGFELVQRKIYTGRGGINWIPKLDWEIELDLRQEFVNQSIADSAGTYDSAPLQSTLQIVRTINTQSGGVKIKLGGQRHFSRPGLNDLYWNPGGNSNLNPEIGWTADALIAWDFSNKSVKNKGQLHAVISAEAWYSQISDWIQWAPSASGFWQAYNLAEVQSRGAALRVTLSGNMGLKTKWTFNSSYTFTKAKTTLDNNEDAFLLYNPQHIGNSSFRIKSKDWSVELNSSYSGQRHTSTDGFSPLAGYGELACQFNYSWLPNGALSTAIPGIELLFRIDNLLNTYYESVRSRPMPGRTYRVGLALNFDINKKQKISIL